MKTFLLQFDEEDYESLDKGVLAPNIDALAAQLKKSLEERVQAAAASRPMPSAQAKRRTLETIPPQSRPVTKTAQHPSTLPLQANKSQAVQGHLNDEYDSDEYESVRESVSVLLAQYGLQQHGMKSGSILAFKYWKHH
jgi:hypothetical protein